MRPAAKAAAHTAAMLDAWHQAGIARADLAVRTANAAMLWYADRPLDALPLALARAHNVKQADIYIRPARGHAWPMVLLDDVDIAMAQRVAKHYATLVVHTSAQGGCHLWLRLTRALDEAQRRQVQRWHRALIRRSQRRRLTWAAFWKQIAPRLPRARIVHNFFVPPAVWLTRTGSRMV
jgi:hypothetical protein